jgi:hypothetical protein
VASDYQNNLAAASMSFPVSSDAVFLGRGAKPPNKAQNSPASASAINFPSSTEYSKLSDLVYVISNTQGTLSELLTNCSDFTLPLMESVFDILHNFKSFCSLLNA